MAEHQQVRRRRQRIFCERKNVLDIYNDAEVIKKYRLDRAGIVSVTSLVSTLDDSGLVPPSPPPSDYFMSSINILHNDVFHALAVLNPGKAYGPDGVSLIVLKNCACILPG
ncbi:hypothetical protein E2C01_006953 [Portunus trituberculatus]|uniref:Uncharacterized protein n=1 Tax=Portunus trituberculatus TaxID=210409 RepID=A0A5B7CZI7_PORTR|nr:hypothetical protein [Portunus trituberculatus]